VDAMSVKDKEKDVLW